LFMGFMRPGDLELRPFDLGQLLIAWEPSSSF